MQWSVTYMSRLCGDLKVGSEVTVDVPGPVEGEAWPLAGTWVNAAGHGGHEGREGIVEQQNGSPETASRRLTDTSWPYPGAVKGACQGWGGVGGAEAPGRRVVRAGLLVWMMTMIRTAKRVMFVTLKQEVNG